MALRFQVLRPPTAAPLHAECCVVLHGQPRAGLSLPPAWMSLSLPLHGELRLHSGDCTWSLSRGELQVWCGEALQLQATHDAHWLCLAAPLPLWSQRLSRRHIEDELLPWQGVASPAVRRHFVRLARALRGRDLRGDAAHGDGTAVLAALLADVSELQLPLARALALSPGRTALRRRQTLLRLLRVRHRLGCQLDRPLDLDRLAAAAHYSPCHLSRTHRLVFAETLADYAARLRNDYALKLLRDTTLPVGTITHALGFESQSAFCRAFKHSFGVTATQARRESIDTPLLAQA